MRQTRKRGKRALPIELGWLPDPVQAFTDGGGGGKCILRVMLAALRRDPSKRRQLDRQCFAIAADDRVIVQTLPGRQ
jgi:hypothetical protein